jgi:Transposase DDE domain
MHLVVADSIYGENAELEAKLFAAQFPYIMGLRPSHGVWQFVEDEAHPPAFTPAEAAARLPREAWQRKVRFDSHGKELARSIVELELGTSDSPTKSVRLIAATLDPRQVKPESTWYLATSLPLARVSAEQVYEIYRLRDWIEHYYKPVKHELGWADYQMRPERAIVRHWQLVMLAYTFSLLVGALPEGEETGQTEQEPPAPAAVETVDTDAPVSGSAGGKSGPAAAAGARIVWNATLRRVRAWVCPWARLQLYWRRWSTAAPPPELAALLAHVAHSRPLEPLLDQPALARLSAATGSSRSLPASKAAQE